jgi:hypothetical protein
LGSPQGPNIIDWPKILAVGIASPAATVVTSRFGVAGTLLGLALSAIFITAAVDVLKVYLARIPGAVTTTIPAGGLRKRSLFRRVFGRTKVPFRKFASLPRARRRSILIRGVVAAGVSILVGLIVVTALEFGVGKSLSCWVWDECPKEPPAEGGSSRTARASTLPSVLGGGRRAGSSSIPQEEDGPSNLRQQPGVQQQQPGVQQQQPGSSPGTPPQAPSQQAPPPPRPAADPSVQRQQPAQRQGPSGVPTGEEQQQAPPGAAPEVQQQPTPGAAPEEEQPLGEGEQPPGAANP